jgi:hypothetical protein
MLPAPFQMPAGVLLVLAGLVSCFAGYRLFRVVLGIFGFIVGWLFVSSAMGTEQTLWMLLAAFGGGLVGALILIAAYFVGVALIGAGIGAGAASVIWASFGREPGIVPVIVLAIIGALGALALQRYVIIVATAFAGAQTIVIGVAAIMTQRVATEAAVRTVYRVYPIDPLPATQWDLAALFALGIAGLVVQLAITAKGKK